MMHLDHKVHFDLGFMFFFIRQQGRRIKYYGLIHTADITVLLAANWKILITGNPPHTPCCHKIVIVCQLCHYNLSSSVIFEMINTNYVF